MQSTVLAKKFWHSVALLTAALAFYSVSAVAAPPQVVVGTGIGSEGSVTPVSIDLDWVSDGTVALIEFEVTYDSANLTPSLTGCGGVIVDVPAVITVGCSNPSPGVIKVVADDAGLLPIASRTLGTVAFDVSSAAVGIYPLVVQNEVYGDSSAQPVPSGGSTNGQVTVAGAIYSSAPAPGATINLGSVQTGGTNPMQNLAITNIGGAGTLLDVTCTETPDTTAFIISNGSVTGLASGASHNVTVACNAALAPNTYNGTLSCAHNGPASESPAEYSLTCMVTPGPEPLYDSTPAPGATINMSATNVGDSIPAQVVTIRNIGDDNTTLQGSCGLAGPGAPPISLANGGAYSLAKNASKDLTLSCASDAEGDYTATLSCSHNAGTATYTVNCSVGPLKPAIFGSTPVSGGAIALGEVVQNGPAPSAPLTIYNNASAPAQDLLLTTCGLSGDAPPISVSGDISGSSVGPGGSIGVTFSCATDTVNSFSATYSCDYILDDSVMPAGSAASGTASWPVTCTVRDAESAVQPNPPSGTQLTAEADPGGSAQFDVMFSETNNEGEDGSVTGCSLADGSNFAINPLPTFPLTVPAGGSVTISVVGTDPGGVDSISDTLNCTYSDSSNPEGVDVTYPLLITFGGDATFLVSKTFTDGSPASVTVTISCDTGLPLQQSKVISQGNPVNFVVTSYQSGAMNCSITETSTNGYTAAYTASGDSQSDNTGGCHFSAIGGGDSNACAIENTPAPVTVSIRKEWLIDGTIGDEFVPSFELTLYCDSQIVDGTPDYPMESVGAAPLSIPTSWYKEFSGIGDQTFPAQVIPAYPSTHCWVEEDVDFSAVETQNGCGNITVSAGSGASCTITNTVFYEGIPTLSQWGLMILVLLTLGVGLVGVRRFS